ncbi:hypothetical protein C2S52_004455 [Perilla frutescens var. hirtella]|nr:hypothetical protein C2S51_011138 [Perilla frutescens var. frutescens]KAH6793978.1 hypothetical protein C2S52_004455 [Perilla frutescens var. hirtella]
MVELCLMASHGYPPGMGVGFHQEHASSRVSDEFHHFLPYHGSKQDLVDPLSFSLSGQQKEEWRSPSGFLNSNHFFRFDSTCRRPAVIDFQDTSPDSVVLGVGIVERCARHEKILKLLMSGSIEEEDRLLNLSMLYDLTGPQSLIADSPQQPFVSHFRGYSDEGQTMPNLIYPTRELYFNEPCLDLAGDRSSCPEKVYHPDGQLPHSYTSTEMADMLSVISDVHSLKNTNKSSRQTMLVPYFERRRRSSATSTDASKIATEKVRPLKSHDKVKEKTSRKKKTTGTRTGNERDAYCNSYLHACESLLSVIMDRKQQGKNTILSLKKSGPQLPRLLTQFSASIAGTGIAVVLSVLCRVACNRVPFCASKLLSTGLGLGLVWLSWAVNRLRNTVVSISKTSGKTDVKEEEMMNHLDRNLKDIYFRAVALIAVVALKVA